MFENVPSENWAEKTILVTGASGWIGEGICLALLNVGARVIAHHRSQLPPSLVGKVEEVRADLTSIDEIKGIAAAVKEMSLQIDGLVNNAAAQPVQPFSEISEKGYDLVLDSGLKAPFFLVQQLLPHFAPSASIVNIASIEGQGAPPGHAHYGSAKGGLLSLTSTLARELAPIRVNALLPGLINRPGLEREWPEGVKRWRERSPLAAMGEREDVAAATLFLLSTQARWITGSELHVDGGMHTTAW